MKNKNKFLIPLMVLLAGCASYRAAPLNSLSHEMVPSSETKKSDLIVMAKTFNKADCARYLDRDVIAEGYRPIQLFIQNNSDTRYLFSLNRVSLSCARPEEVAEKVHTSTVGRATGYGVGALFLWPLAIPAVVDGVKSAKANDSLDIDFSAKAANDQTIQPHSYMNKLIFVPANEYQSTFTLTLVDQESGKPKEFEVSSN
jgi:hypothetical protein